MNIQPHQQRMIEELDELDERIYKLNRFLACPESWDLSAIDIHLLNQQFDAMCTYRKFLKLRVSTFSKDHA